MGDVAYRHAMENRHVCVGDALVYFHDPATSAVGDSNYFSHFIDVRNAMIA